MWRMTISAIPEFPRVSFHSLRHSHASALIAAKIDVVKVSRRLGHSSPVITLGVYAHLFGDGTTVPQGAWLRLRCQFGTNFHFVLLKGANFRAFSLRFYKLQG
jgi:integrase